MDKEVPLVELVTMTRVGDDVEPCLVWENALQVEAMVRDEPVRRVTSSVEMWPQDST